MKKTLFLLLVVTILFSACNRKKFVKELVGTWKLNTDLFSGEDQTKTFDSVYRNYQLVISDGYLYNESWKTYSFFRDSTILPPDTTGFDSVRMRWVIRLDTLRFIDTTITPHFGTGKWSLLNSEEDLQLRDDSDATNPKQWRILTLDKSHLNISAGNEERHLTH